MITVNIWKNRLAFALYITAISPSSVLAFDMDELLSMSLKELSQIPVTIASRTEETFIDAPSSVTVLTQRQITQLGVRTLTELFNYVPGFQSYMSPHESNRSLILARGISDVYGKNLLLMIDGHRINDEYTGGFTFAEHLLSLYNVKQVEFIRGPGSAMYGSNAFSGVINIITQQNNKAAITSGSNNARGVTASTTGNSGKLDASMALNYYRDDGQNYNNLTDTNGFNKSTQDPVEVFESRVDLSYQRSRLVVEYMDTKLNDYYVFRRISNSTNFNNSSRFGLYIEHDFKLSQGWQGSSRIGTVRHQRKQQTLIVPTDLVPFSDDWQQNTHDAQIDFNYRVQTGHQFNIGAYASRMNIPRAFSSDTSSRFVLDKTRRTLGAYIQDQLDLSEDIRLTTGLRYDNYSDFGNTLNPRLALLYHWRENESFKFMYGRAYRAPSLGDIYDTEGTLNSSPNLFLKPVIVNSYELAYLHTAENNNVIFTWFYNVHSNFIVARPDPNNSSLSFFDNVYDNKTQGLELDLQWQFNQRWSTRTGLTHIISRTTDTLVSGAIFSDPDFIAPETYGNLQLNYQQTKWNWNLSAVANDGIKALLNQNSIIVLNSKIIYRINKRWDLSANIRNFLDKNYATPQGLPMGLNQSGNSIQELPSREREIFINLRYSGGT